jgi:hypothetical protein
VRADDWASWESTVKKTGRFELSILQGCGKDSVLMSVWRTCWQQGRSTLDFLSQLLRGPPSQELAISGLDAWPSDGAIAPKSRGQRPLG